jgi:uncharacterized protein YdeI (YjbR/CyaY-like superfamily)
VTGKDGRPIESFSSREAWAAWLAAEHATSDGVWLKLAKKGSGVRSVSQAEAVEVALAFGWIDGQAASFDDDHFLQRFTRRRPQSRWSRINRERATTLIERGEMHLAGLREVERAKADGRWDAAYEPPSTATVPDDLRRELDRHPGAAERFDALDGRNRYAILYRIEEAKRPETRARRIVKFVALLAEGKTPYPS